MYLSSFLGITKFLPSKKLTIMLPLNQGPPAAMVRHLASYEEFLSSMSWISILRNLQLFSFIGHRSSITFIRSHVSCQKVIHQTSLSGPLLCHVAFLRIISKDHTYFLMISTPVKIHPDKHIYMKLKKKVTSVMIFLHDIFL